MTARSPNDQTEASIINHILMEHGARPDIRVWRNETGGVWVGKQAGKTREGHVVLKGARMIQAGLCKGSSDLIGLRAHTITPDDVGATIGQFVAVEVKRPGARGPTREQETFIDVVNRLGGVAGVVRSAVDLEHLLSP